MRCNQVKCSKSCFKSFPNQYICILISHNSKYLVIVPYAIKIKFNLDLDIESTGKTSSICNNPGRAPVMKKLLILGSKEIDTITNSNIYVS